MNKAAKEKQKIHILDESIVAKIAAGEVVERPASALKELLENSIDAGATEIKIHIKSAGKRLIKVTDNGAGMGAEDAKLAFHQHATSKISSEEDLNSILTLGFRGEALSSIAAVAEISLDTSNSLESTQIEVKRGKIISKDGTIQKGTSIAIKNLFANIPARQKFLRSDATEYKHMTDIFLQHAVANPAIAFDFKNEEKTIYNLPSTEDLQVRIFDIWGSRIAKKLINVNFDGPTLQINGFVGHPEIARRDRTMQYITLNRRPINSNLISKAVEDAFHSAKPDINHPIFFLNIQIDPKSIDVNVHPRKMEVKFSNTREIYTSV